MPLGQRGAPSGSAPVVCVTAAGEVDSTSAPVLRQALDALLDGDVRELTVDLAAHEARVGGEAVALTRTEFELLAALTARPHEALTRRRLIDTVWGPSWVGDERIVDVHIGHLRRKLGEDQAAFVDTVRGVGYRMVAR